MTVSLRRSIALLIAFEMLLLVIAFIGFGTQGDPGQDAPIAFGVVLVVIPGTGSDLGLLTAVLVLAVTLSRRGRSRWAARSHPACERGATGRISG